MRELGKRSRQAYNLLRRLQILRLCPVPLGVCCLFALLATVFTACQRLEHEQFSVASPRGERYVGFAVFGPDWLQEQTFTDEAERLKYLEEQGYLVAQHTSRLYGNVIRVPISLWSILGQDTLIARTPELTTKPVYQIEEELLRSALDRLGGDLEANQEALERDQTPGDGRLLWRFWDAFFSGVQKYNQELASAPNSNYRPVFVDLLLVERPPTLILEASIEGPRRSLTDSFAENSLWQSYRHLYLLFIRKLIQRYGKGYENHTTRAFLPVMMALEMFNEPDYEWLPDEAKIERALNPDAYPCDKYLTQLHLPQVPENDLPGKGCVRRHGLYQEQDLNLPPTRTALRDFRWGLKFEKYVAAFADLHEHASFAAKDEIHKGGASVRVISSAVTHVNLDWFLRMFKANPETFHYIDAAAIHPYHWPQHDIHNMQFIGSPFERDWTTMSPREFASLYCKRFDFLQILAALVTQPTLDESLGFSGKNLWITEFGIPTKKLGRDNSEETLRRYPLAIYDRATQVPEGIKAIVWEDKWEAFFDQVSVEFLKQNHVEGFLIYTLRESAGNEANDNNHSNFAFYRSDWSCRLAPETLKRVADFFLKLRDG